MLKRARKVSLAAIAAGSAFIAAGVHGPTYAQSETVMHVSVININNQDRIGRGPHVNAVAEVWIMDQFGNPVENATVVGDFSGCFTRIGASDTTDAYGHATVFGGNVKCQSREGPCEITFTVRDVTRLGATYDPTANVQTSASHTACTR